MNKAAGICMVITLVSYLKKSREADKLSKKLAKTENLLAIEKLQRSIDDICHEELIKHCNTLTKELNMYRNHKL